MTVLILHEKQLLNMITEYQYGHLLTMGSSRFFIHSRCLIIILTLLLLPISEVFHQFCSSAARILSLSSSIS
jgi:hypothetical protein